MDMTLTEQISAVEAVLFASGEPVAIEVLSQALDLSPIEFEVVLEGLKQRSDTDCGRKGHGSAEHWLCLDGPLCLGEPV